jgi:hypothetical protein
MILSPSKGLETILLKARLEVMLLQKKMNAALYSKPSKKHCKREKSVQEDVISGWESNLDSPVCSG